MKLNTTNQMVREFDRVLGNSPRLKNHELMRVPVYDKTGNTIATVHKICTSIGAAKAAGAIACEWTFRFGVGGWVCK
jgi:hypothetical protein